MPGGITHDATGQSPSSTHLEAAGRGGERVRTLGHADALECEDQSSLMLVSTVVLLKVNPLSPFKSDNFKLSTSLSCM